MINFNVYSRPQTVSLWEVSSEVQRWNISLISEYFPVHCCHLSTRFHKINVIITACYISPWRYLADNISSLIRLRPLVFCGCLLAEPYCSITNGDMLLWDVSLNLYKWFHIFLTFSLLFSCFPHLCDRVVRHSSCLGSVMCQLPLWK